MKKNIFVFLLLLISIKGKSQNKFTCTGESILYQTSSDTGNSDFSSYNETSNSYTHVNSSTPTINFNINAIGYNTIDDYIYGLEFKTNRLIKLFPNANSNNMGTVTGLPNGVAFAAGDFETNTNFLYVVSTTDNSMYKIDISTMQATLINLNQSLNCADITYSNPAGKFYGVQKGTGKLLEISKSGTVIDLGVPMATDIYSLDSHTDHFGAAFSDNLGNLYFSHNSGGQLYKLSNVSNNWESKQLISTNENFTYNDGAACALSEPIEIIDPDDPKPTVISNIKSTPCEQKILKELEEIRSLLQKRK